MIYIGVFNTVGLGLGAGFPVLRKTNRGPKEEEKSESSPSQVLISAIITPHMCDDVYVHAVLMLCLNTTQNVMMGKEQSWLISTVSHASANAVAWPLQ